MLNRLALQFGDDFTVVNKPSGWSTHAVESPTNSLGSRDWGIFEWAQLDASPEATQQKLYVIHRLDKSTTGVLALARSVEVARKCLPWFQDGKVQKVYQLITKALPEDEGHPNFVVRSEIEKGDGKMKNRPDSANWNAETHFQKIKGNAFFTLWEARPHTGRTHQIRLHAAQIHRPILGDVLYGGDDFPHLCLHAASLQFPGLPAFVSDAPVFFNRMGLLRDRELILILSALDSRQRLFDFLHKPQQAFRLLHKESPDYQADLFGPVLWISWFRESPPTAADLERWNFVAQLLRRQLLIRPMINRGKNPQGAPDYLRTLDSGSVPEWSFQENELNFSGRPEQGLSPGLFLDQRENRRWVQENSKGKKVLNLFSYTGGFTVAACKGVAESVTTVDLNAKYLQWAKHNLSLNQILPEIATDWFAADCEQFVAGAVKRKRQFDLIICDPPSFGRNGKQIWRIEKNLPDLLQQLGLLLSPRGQILLSCNFAPWDITDLQVLVHKALPHLELQLLPWRGLDFERQREPLNMKSLLIHKKERP